MYIWRTQTYLQQKVFECSRIETQAMALSFKVSKLEIIDEELEMGEINTSQGEILRLAEE